MFPPDSSLSLDLALHIKVWAVYINLGVQPALARGDKTRERIFCWFLETLLPSADRTVPLRSSRASLGDLTLASLFDQPRSL